MVVKEGLGISAGLNLIDYLALTKGQALLFKRGDGENLIAAEGTVDEVLFDQMTCRIKVRKIVKQGSESKIAVGDKIIATLAELTSV